MAKPSGLENLRFPVFWWNSVETAAAEPKPEYCDIEVAAKPPIDPFKRSPGAPTSRLHYLLHCIAPGRSDDDHVNVDVSEKDNMR